jgi:hypothetical protein
MTGSGSERFARDKEMCTHVPKPPTSELYGFVIAPNG